MKGNRQEKTLGLVGRLQDLASGSWVLLMLLAAGVLALVTAVLVAWPAVAYLASRYFGLGG